MERWNRRITTLLIALAAVSFFWATQAGWGDTVLGDVRYRFGLLGMARSAATTATRVDACGWYDAPPMAPACEPASGAHIAYRLIRLAPLAAAFGVVALVLASFAHLRSSTISPGLGPAPFAAASATCLIASILLLTRNVDGALAVYAGRSVDMRGSGLRAAWLAAGLLVVVAVGRSVGPSAVGTDRRTDGPTDKTGQAT